MNFAEWIVLGGGIIFMMLLGVWHLGGILLINRISKPRDRNHLAVLYTFWGILFLHLSEVALGAAALAFILMFPELGGIDKGYGSTMGGLLYLSGINFTTLGYTQMEASGALRLFIMLQALSGFMLITWSATLVYTIWGSRYRD